MDRSAKTSWLMIAGGGGFLAGWFAATLLWRTTEWLPSAFYHGFFLGSLLVSLLAALWAIWPRRRSWPVVCLVLTASYAIWWQAGVFFAHEFIWDTTRDYLSRWGTAGLFVIGLLWMVWATERAAQRIHARRAARGELSLTAQAWVSAEERAARPGALARRIWNPFDTDAWYYGKRNQKLHQSLATFLSYSLFFLLAFLLLSQVEGCGAKIYELPAGGGQQKALAQTVQVQKIIRARYVVNPLSAIKLEVPPIDEVKLYLAEATEHTYQVGDGEGEGAGFGAGTARGKVRFIRLEYSGGDWDLNFGIGGDLNMLIQYGLRTGHKVADRTESWRIGDLARAPLYKSPPLVYMAGQKNINLSNTEVRILNEYLLKKRGMLLADNGGSRRWHAQFLAMMNRVLPHVKPVPIPLDDPIHRIPYPLPFLPYVAPHGGKEALGWKVDGRWVCYYHPGDMGDAWADDHAGVRVEVWEACYQLGVNIIFYAHAEYSKWLRAQGIQQ